MKRALALLCLSSLACGPALRTARRSADEPQSERELQAEAHVASPSCAPLAMALTPGLGALCEGRTAEGIVLASLGAGELATGIGVALKHDITYPGAAIPLLALSDLVLYTEFSRALEIGLSRRLLYVPQDTLPELAVAPFNLRVLSQPDVWAGILGTFAAGLGVTAITGGLSRPFRARPRLFGTDFAPGLGYATGGVIGAGLFEHVAIAEETTFRGTFQSAFARRFGEDQGLVYGALLFGALHAPNAIFLDSSERVSYLAIGVPFLTLIGGYLGWSYRQHGYGLAAPVAIHFWYDLLISAASFAMDPRHNQLSGSIALPF